MVNHPNRNKPAIKGTPTPEQIRCQRDLYGFSQKYAAELIHCSLRSWQQWEKGDRKMHPAFWELFKIKGNIAYW